MRLTNLLQSIRTSQTTEKELLNALGSGTFIKSEAGPLVASIETEEHSIIDVIYDGKTKTTLGSLRDDEQDNPPHLKLRRYRFNQQNPNPTAETSTIGIDISAQAFDALVVKQARENRQEINEITAKKTLNTLLDTAEKSSHQPGRLMPIPVGQNDIVGVVRIRHAERVHDLHLQKTEQRDEIQRTQFDEDARRSRLDKARQLAREAEIANSKPKKPRTQQDEL